MATIPAPAEISALAGSAELHLAYESQIVLDSPWANSRLVLNRGYPRWEGTLRIERTDEEAKAVRIEAWLSSLDGVANDTRIPTERPTPSGDSSAVVRSAMASGVLTHTLTSAWAGAAVGDRVEAEGNHYIIRGLTGRSLVLAPQRPISAGEIIRPTENILVTLSAKRGTPQPRGPDFWGPWTLTWIGSPD